MFKTTPYTYIIRCKTTNQYYYGVKWAKACDPKDFWINYFTSSKYVTELIELYGKDDFEFEIRRTFDTPEKAQLWESKVLRRMNVVTDDKWLNRNNSKSISYEVHPRQGKHHSEEAKRKIGKGNLGKKRTQAMRDAMSKARSGKNHWNYGKKHSEETKRKNRESNIAIRKTSPHLFSPPPDNTGRKHSEETKKKMSGPRGKYQTRRIIRNLRNPDAS